jgi:PAS domain S-box-containing protein
MKRIFIATFFILIVLAPMQAIRGQESSRFAENPNDSDNTDSAKILNTKAGKFLQSSPRECIALANKALSIANKSDNLVQQAVACSILGEAYFSLNDFTKALEYLHQFYDLQLKLGDKAGIAHALNNLGIIYKNQNEYAKALKYYKESIAVKKELGDSVAISTTLNNIGAISEDMSAYPIALKYYRESLDIERQTGNNEGIAISLLNIANVYRKWNRFEKARDFCLQSLQISDSLNFILIQRDCFKCLSDCYVANKQHEKALHFYKKYSHLKDSILNAELEQFAEAQLQYEAFRNEKEIDLLNKQKIIQENEIKSQRTFIYLFVFVIIIIVLISTLIYRQKELKRKSNQLLFKQNKEIKKQKEEIQLTTHLLEEKNKELIKLSIVARFTENPVMIMSPQGDFEWVNESFEKLFGFTVDQLVKERNTNIASQRTPAHIKKLIKECIEQKKTVNYEMHVSTRKNIDVWVQATLTPVLNKAGNIDKLIAIDTDITKVKNAETEILKQKEEIEKQKWKIEKQHKVVSLQRDQILRQNTEITSSIQYASHIQRAVMPPEDEINKMLVDYFILFKPRDIVSGDFYWLTQKGEKIIIAATDCTGHGVPGAFMSMLGVSYLNEISNRLSENNSKEQIRANDILNRLREKVKRSFHLKGTDEDTTDGMDIALCVFDKQSYKLQFSGAYNPLYICRKLQKPSTDNSQKTGSIILENNENEDLQRVRRVRIVKNDNYELIEIKSDKMPIGVFFKRERSFINQVVQLEKGDTFYIFSDGFPDQFGGKDGKKYMYKSFKQLLLEIQDRSLENQKEILNNTFNTWKNHETPEGGTYEQVDDVLIIGIKV